MTTKSAKDLVAEASQNIETLSGEEAAKLVGDPNMVFVDIREAEELKKTGSVRGALHVPRGVLEFQADPASATYNAQLGGGKKLVLYCGSGGRSALGARALTEMRITNVAHVAGGFPALQQAGAPLEGSGGVNERWGEGPGPRRSPVATFLENDVPHGKPEVQWRIVN